MVSVKVDTKELDKDLKKFMKAFQVTSDNALDVLALNTKSDAQGILNSKGTNFTGALSNSIYVEKRQNSRIVGTETGYGLYIEFGRPAGTVPDFEPLKRWVIRKLKVPRADAGWITKLIKRSITEKGTKAQPFLRPAFEKARQRMMRQYRAEFKRQK